MNLTDLHTFCLVAETGTISAAAKKLGVPKSTVSRRVSRLEDSVGLELLRRSPRSVSLTDHGTILHQRSAPSLDGLVSAMENLTQSGSEPTGTLRITTVPGFGHSPRFIRCLKEYGLKYPKVRVQLELTTRLAQLVEEGIDIGVRLHTGPLPGNPSLISRRLMHFERALYASPSYIAEMGQPTTLDDLSAHRIAAHSIIDVREIQWIRDGRPSSKARPLPGPRWLFNDTTMLERLALSGAGLAMLPTPGGNHWVERGELVRVLPNHVQRGAAASLVWPKSRHLAPRVRAFIDHAVQTIKHAP